MTKYKVVCNQSDYVYKFSDKERAIEAANRHSNRENHYPVYIYEVDEDNEMTRVELLAISTPDPAAGILNIETV